MKSLFVTTKYMQEGITRAEFQEKMGNIDERFVAVDKRFDVVEERFDRLTCEVVIIKERLDTMVTKQEFGEFKNDVMTSLDYLVKMANKAEQERIMFWERQNRLDEKVDSHDVRICKLEARTIA